MEGGCDNQCDEPEKRGYYQNDEFLFKIEWTREKIISHCLYSKILYAMLRCIIKNKNFSTLIIIETSVSQTVRYGNAISKPSLQ